MLFRSQHIYVSTSKKHGWGIFTNSPIYKDEIIEECPYNELGDSVDENLLKYSFLFEKKNKLTDEKNIEYIFACGVCTCLNSSKKPNVVYFIDVDRQIIVFKSSIDIEAGSELFLSYGFD